MAATLGGLIEHLEILRVLVAPAGLGTELNGLVVHDPVDELRIEPGDLVLGVGIDADRHDAAELVRNAGTAKAAAIVVKLRGPATPDPLLAAGRTAGVALLGVSQDIGWGQLYTLLRTALAGLGVPSGPGPGGVPVGDLFTLANAVAAMVGGPTTIETPQSVVLAYSSLDEPIDAARQDTILGRRVPDPWLRRLHEDGVFHRLWSSEGVVKIDYSALGAFQPRLAIAVRAGGQILGSIWVAQGRVPFGPEAETALREAARIAALHLVRHQVGDDLERRRNGEMLRSVLEARRPAELLAEMLRVPRQSFTTVIGFQLDATDAADAAVHVERVAGLIALYADAYRHQVVCTGIGRVIYVLFASTTKPDPNQLRRFATAIVEQSRDSLGLAVHAGIGPTVAGLEQLVGSRNEADLVLRVLAGPGGQDRTPAVAARDDVHARLVLLRIRDLVATEPRLFTHKLDVLTALDAERHTSYLPTLRAYLDAFGDIPAAAGSLNVHPNTYRYRLRRLVELAKLDLADPIERLVLHLQLQLLPDVASAPDSADGQRGRKQVG